MATNYPTWQELSSQPSKQLQNSPEAPAVAFVRVIPAPSVSSRLKKANTPQHTSQTIQEQQWYSYCFQTDKSTERHKELLQFLLKRKKFDFLLYTHFDDILHETEDETCKGNHYHLLTTGDFTSVTGNMKKPSQMYHLEWLRAQCKIHGHIAPSSKVVKNINAYLEYLKQCPRNLCAYSDCFIELAEEGYFHATEKEWNLAVQAYMINIRDNIPEKPETGPYFKPRPPPNQKAKTNNR